MDGDPEGPINLDPAHDDEDGQPISRLVCVGPNGAKFNGPFKLGAARSGAIMQRLADGEANKLRPSQLVGWAGVSLFYYRKLIKHLEFEENWRQIP